MHSNIRRNYGFAQQTSFTGMKSTAMSSSCLALALAVALPCPSFAAVDAYPQGLMITHLLDRCSLCLGTPVCAICSCSAFFDLAVARPFMTGIL